MDPIISGNIVNDHGNEEVIIRVNRSKTTGRIRWGCQYLTKEHTCEQKHLEAAQEPPSSR